LSFLSIWSQKKVSKHPRETAQTGNLRFSQLSYFSGGGEKLLKELGRARTVIQFKEGHQIPFAWHGHEGFYYLHEGYGKVTYKRASGSDAIRIAGPNDLVGFARWYGLTAHYGMISLSNLTTSFFRKSDFLKITSKSSYLADEVIRWLMKVLITQEDRIYTLKNSTARGRVSGTLAGLRRSFGQSIGGNNSVLAAPIDRKTLADLSGVAIEVLSRVLRDLEDEKIIRRDGRIIVIIDPAALEKAAGY
jgi:CRP-like cAMP-binding protein